MGSLVVVATHRRFTSNEKLIQNNGYVAQLLKFRKFACGPNNKNPCDTITLLGKKLCETFEPFVQNSAKEILR